MQAANLPVSKRDEQADLLFKAEYRQVCKRTDRMIAVLMGLQWPAAIAAAWFIASRTWEGDASSVHPHLVAAVYLGGLLTLFPVYFALFHAGERHTRHIVAACQMMMSGLLIHVTGGRIETHFHVFGSLAFLAFYLDWEVLITASAVTLANHVVMNYIAPASIFGTSTGSDWRLIEHALWVVFFDCFLVTSCIHSLKSLRAATGREAYQAKLLHQAHHDALTGLGNRLLIQKEIFDLRNDPAKKDQSFAIMALDLDRFKEVNDTYGHQTGDMVLSEVSQRLRKQIRDQDTLVRMGGDEFAVVISNCPNVKIAEGIAARMIESLNQPFYCGSVVVRIGLSVGICLNPEVKIDVSEFFHQADQALYRVKNGGRNHFHVFEGLTSAQLSQRQRQQESPSENKGSAPYLTAIPASH